MDPSIYMPPKQKSIHNLKTSSSRSNVKDEW